MRAWGAAATALLVIILQVPAAGQPAASVVQSALRALGAESLDSVTFSGTAAIGNFGQSRTISFGVASTSLRGYTVTMDFTRGSSRITAYAAPPQVQGGPPTGDFEQIAGPTDTWQQQLDVWLSPWGFLRGAAAHAATVRNQKIEDITYKVVTWVPTVKSPSGQTYRVVGYINPDNFVERVETWIDHPFLGDLPVERRYSDYRAFGALQVPTRFTERRLAMEIFVAVIGTAQANPPDLLARMTPSSRPGAARSAGSDPAVASASAASPEMVAEGVYRIPGEYAALAVDLRDFSIVIGGGESEARGQAIIAETKRVFPKKPIRYVVSTHPHFDHAAVLPPFVAEGITIILDDVSRYFVEQALSSPRTLVGDALARSRKKPKVEGVIEKLVLGDAMRSVELHHLERNEHSDATLIAYLPRERMIFADIEWPAPGQPASPAIAGLMQNLDRLALDFDRVYTVRPSPGGRPIRREDFATLMR